MPEYQYIPLVGREDELGTLLAHCNQLQHNKGGILCLTGETGYGKTSLLERFARECKKQLPQAVVLQTACHQPVGMLQIGKAQPLYPFRHIMEQLAREDRNTAKKKLYQSIGMTVLATLPLVGDVFYAAKEISRDLKEFKNKGKKDEPQKFSSQGLIADYVQAIATLAKEGPLVLLLDDMQWCDAQSVQLLALLSQRIATIPVLCVLAYRESEARLAAHSLIPFADSGVANRSIAAKMELRALTPDNARDMCKLHLPAYKPNEQFEQWLLEHSGGVPGIVAEYLRYFRMHSPFDEAGRLSEHFEHDEFIPATVQALFATAIEQLSEDDRAVLSLASVEGRECTVFVLAQLMNTDVLTAIRRLRSLQQRTGIIRSRGAETQYGIRTTVYEFTQALYHKYFLQSLEYEERTAIHAQIAEILQKQFEVAENDIERDSIAPYLAAHSGESGDKERMKTMVLHTAYTADRYDSDDTLDYLFEVHTTTAALDTPVMEQVNREFVSLLNNRRREELVHNAHSVATHATRFGVEHFAAVRDAVTQHFLAGHYANALQVGETFLLIHGENLLPHERLELCTLLARCLSETGNLEKAEEWFTEALAEAQALHNREWKCLALVGYALLMSKRNNAEKMEELLRQAVEIALTLPREFQLLISANIADLLHDTDAAEAERHRVAASRLASELQFYTFAEEAFRHS